MPIDYQKGQIYKIVSDQTDKIYIGSTTKQYLSQRFSQHKNDFRAFQNGKRNNLSSYEIMKYDDAQIILLESYPCNFKAELHACERHWIEQSPTAVNKIIPTRTVKEYCQTWYKKNLENITKKHAEYNKANKEKISAHKREYYLKKKMQ